MLRKLFQTTDPASQPFVISGSGTLGWDLVSANLAEAGDDVLVLHAGYFADSFADCLQTYGAKPTQLKAPIGSSPQLPDIEKALKEKKYKLVTVTHVDTSTGVLADIKSISELVHRVSPETLVIVDGVCSVGSEEIDFDKWQLDGVITASQKGVGVPAGLSISMFSGRAIKTFQSRKTPAASYFASFKNWMPSKFSSAVFKDPPNISLSYAKLRSQEALIFRNPFATANPRSAHLSYPDPLEAFVRALRSTPSNFSESQEGCCRPWPQAAGV
jgi:alanine-glyoxylate transaminase/serine-glyoxylate transaminase/serine-pyruvate transaminase